MQKVRRSVLAVVAIMVAVSLSAAPRQPQQQSPRQRDTQQKQACSNPWTRLIHKILDDVIPPSDNRLSVPPG
jgi:acetyl-CoA carboxylase carboxyltransferase component